MKKILFWGMLLLAATLLFSCHKEAKLTENPPATKTNESSLLGGKATTIEALSEQYFKIHPHEAANAQKIISVTKEFFAINQQTKEFDMVERFQFCHTIICVLNKIPGASYQENLQH